MKEHHRDTLLAHSQTSPFRYMHLIPAAFPFPPERGQGSLLVIWRYEPKNVYDVRHYDNKCGKYEAEKALRSVKQ